MADIVLTTQQAAEALQVSELTLTKWLRSGRIKGAKVGRNWRIPESEIQRVSSEGLHAGRECKTMQTALDILDRFMPVIAKEVERNPESEELKEILSLGETLIGKCLEVRDGE